MLRHIMVLWVNTGIKDNNTYNQATTFRRGLCKFRTMAWDNIEPIDILHEIVYISQWKFFCLILCWAEKLC